MNTKHTPGPWTCAKPTRLKQNYISSESGPVAITSSSSEVSRDTNLANARLIAAAPELLAVLTRILYAHDTGNCGAVTGEAILCGQFASAARDAIDKATGGAA